MSTKVGYDIQQFKEAFMRILKVAALAVVAASCIPATPPSAPVPIREVAVASSPEAVWSRLLVILTDLNLPIENMDKASWFLRTQEMRLSKADAAASLDCGTELGAKRAEAPYMELYARVTILLRPNGDSTGVRVQVAPRGWDTVNARSQAQGNMFAGDPNVACVSTGRLENSVFSSLKVR